MEKKILDADAFISYIADGDAQSANDGLDIMVKAARFDTATEIRFGRTRTDKVAFAEGDEMRQVKAALNLAQKVKWVAKHRAGGSFLLIAFDWPEGTVESWTKAERNDIVKYATALTAELDIRGEAITAVLRKRLNH